MLKPQDLIVSLKLLQGQSDSPAPTYAGLAAELFLSPSEAHAAVVRCLEAGFLRKPSNSSRTMPIPVLAALEEFLIHGLRYVWPAKRGPITRGFATATSLESIAKMLSVPAPEVPLVWPHPEGSVRGESVEPLYPRALLACQRDADMREWLALLDILRLKSGRDASLAAAAIHHRLASWIS